MTTTHTLAPSHPLAGGPLYSDDMETPALVALVLKLSKNKKEERYGSMVFGMDSLKDRLDQLERQYNAGRGYVPPAEQECELVELLHREGRFTLLEQHFQAAYADYIEMEPRLHTKPVRA